MTECNLYQTNGWSDPFKSFRHLFPWQNASQKQMLFYCNPYMHTHRKAAKIYAIVLFCISFPYFHGRKKTGWEGKKGGLEKTIFLHSCPTFWNETSYKATYKNKGLDTNMHSLPSGIDFSLLKLKLHSTLQTDLFLPCFQNFIDFLFQFYPPQAFFF